jgi:hypothetical protein
MSNDLNFADAPFPSQIAPGFTPASNVWTGESQLAAQQVQAERHGGHHGHPGSHHHGNHGHHGGHDGGNHHGGGHHHPLS